jgi:hypothetical protein
VAAVPLVLGALAVSQTAATVKTTAPLTATGQAVAGARTVSAGPPWWVIPRASAVGLATALVKAVQPLDPLAIFTAPPPLDPPNLLNDVPPFEQSSYEIQAVLTVVANELARLEAARAALIQNFFPLTADALLPLFEQLLGLPVSPPAALAARRQLVATYMQRLKSEGRGLDWVALITQAVGTTNWNYQEHDPGYALSPPANTVNVNIPQAAAGYAWPLIRDLTPAHLVINQGYTGGFIVGSSPIGSNL